MESIDELVRRDAAAWQRAVAAAETSEVVSASADIAVLKIQGPGPRRNRLALSLSVAALVVCLLGAGTVIVAQRLGHNDRTPTNIASNPAAGSTRAVEPSNATELIITPGELDPQVPVALPANEQLTKPPLLPGTKFSNSVSASWSFFNTSPDGRQITIGYRASFSCFSSDGLSVSQTDSAVVIAVIGHVSSGMCLDMSRYGFATVTLDEPLGQRSLYHATVTYQ